MNFPYEPRQYGDTGDDSRFIRNSCIKPKPNIKTWNINDEENFPSSMRCHNLNLNDEDGSCDVTVSYHRLHETPYANHRENNDFEVESHHATDVSRRNSITSHAYDETKEENRSTFNFAQPNEKQKTPKKIPKCKFCADSDGTCPCPIHLPAVRSRYMRVFMDNNQNSITINVFKNGENRETPTMIHISKFHMCSMDDIMRVIDKFVRFPVGYAYALYTLLGDLVEDPMELEPYETYIVVNNCKKKFVHMEYGCKKPTAIYMNRCRRIPYASTYMVPKYPMRK
ncbi:unnamed protein product [Orchesella dallaii]|uniref:Doublecortin domain-containing protein n=1 Tax=Orchesella dallaii TaxID=48710 RepID=A0ABP1QE43_9HEXA